MNRCLDPACLDGPTDGDPLPRYTDGDDCLCPRCGTLLERRLGDLTAQRDALRAVLGGLRSSVRGDNKPTKGTPPVPLNLAAHDHLTLMQATLVSWVRMVAEERDLRGPDRDDLAVLAGWLLNQLPWLVQHGAVGDFADEVRDLARVADGLTHLTRRPTRVGADCFDCRAPLVRPVDRDGLEEDRVVCNGCGREYTVTSYNLALAAAAEEASRIDWDDEQWATPEALAHDLGRSVNTLKRWRRDALVRARTLEGVVFFSVADAQAEHETRGSRRTA